MPKKKKSSKEKNLRKQLEILKAQIKNTQAYVSSKQKNKEKLPIGQIKKDLIKTAVFATLSVISLVLLYKMEVTHKNLFELLAKIKALFQR